MESTKGWLMVYENLNCTYKSLGTIASYLEIRLFASWIVHWKMTITEHNISPVINYDCNIIKISLTETTLGYHNTCSKMASQACWTTSNNPQFSFFTYQNKKIKKIPTFLSGAMIGNLWKWRLSYKNCMPCQLEGKC